MRSLELIEIRKCFLSFHAEFLYPSLPSKSVKTKIYRNIIMLVDSYGCKPWFLTSIEECRQRVFENRVLGRILGPKRDEVRGEWRRLHEEELYTLYSSPDIIRVIKSRKLRWAGYVARMGIGEVHTGL
jgi:hypothetical protein